LKECIAKLEKVIFIKRLILSFINNSSHVLLKLIRTSKKTLVANGIFLLFFETHKRVESFTKGEKINDFRFIYYEKETEILIIYLSTNSKLFL